MLSTPSTQSLPALRLSRRRLVTSTASTAAIAAVAAPLPLLTGNRAAAQTPVAADSADFDAFTAELNATIEEWMTTLDVPGVAVGVIAGDQEYTAGFGVTSIDHPLDVDADTLFQIGSIGKTYTATAVMKLVEDGLVDLDAPVRTYLPDFQVADEEVAAAVTVRQLLNHSAGWLGDVFVDTGTGDDAYARYVELLAENPQMAPLGEYFSYNNASFVTAGRLIEVVTGKTYLEALTELVLQPLGLERTYLYPEQIMTQAFAIGHAGTEGNFQGEMVVVEPWALPRSVTPAGNHISSVTDMLRYARFHLGDGTNADGEVVMSPEIMEAFSTPTNRGGALGDVVIDGVAAAWMIRDINGTLIQQHGGSTNGQESHLVLVPERQFAIAVLTNSTTGVVLSAVVSAWALERFLGLATPELTPLDSTGLDLSQYVGTYGYSDGEGMGQDLVIVEENGELSGYAEIVGMPIIETDGPLVFVGEDLVQFPIFGLPLLAEFVRDENGDVTWLLFSGRLQPKTEE